MNGKQWKRGINDGQMILRIKGPPTISFGSSSKSLNSSHSNDNNISKQNHRKNDENSENHDHFDVFNGSNSKRESFSRISVGFGVESKREIFESDVKNDLEPAKTLTMSFSHLINSISMLTDKISNGNVNKQNGRIMTPLQKSMNNINLNGKIANPLTSVRRKLYQNEENEEMREDTTARKTRHSAQTESLNRALLQREIYLKEIASDEGLKKRERDKKEEEKKLRKSLMRKEKRRQEKEERNRMGNKEKGDKIIKKPKNDSEEPKKERQKRRKLSHYMSPAKPSAIRIEDYSPEVQEALRRNTAVVDLIEKIFDQLPDGHRISKKEELATNNANHNLDGFGSSTYGEILPVAIHNIISLLGIGEEDVFYDLGSGIGKAVIQVALQTKCKRSVGVELSETRYSLSLDAKQDAFNRLSTFESEEIDLLTPRRHQNHQQTIKEVMDSISFVNSDILQVDFRDATCIYWNNICFNASASLKIVAKFNDLPEGTRILSSRKLCGRHSAACLRKKEPCSYMYLLKKDIVSCTWAVSCTVFIYEVRKRLVPNWWDQ